MLPIVDPGEKIATPFQMAVGSGHNRTEGIDDMQDAVWVEMDQEQTEPGVEVRVQTGVGKP